MKDALQEEAAKHIAVSPLANQRPYDCKAPGCARRAYATGYCNAHYIRFRKGQPLEAPLRSRKRAGECIECGAPTNRHGGLGRCKKHYTRFRAATIKQVCVTVLGGACTHCGGVYPSCVFDFHHKGEKAFAIGNAMTYAGMLRIAKEVVQCDLLCANCHRMEHNNVSV